MSDATPRQDRIPDATDASRAVVVFAGGEPMRYAAATVPPAAYVIAADSGLHTAQAMGVRVDAVIGDFDSVRADALATAEASGATIERHPVAKDQTDLELALDRALERSPRELIVIGGHGGRLDHLLGNVLLLAAPAYAGVRVQAYMGDGHVHVVRDLVELHGVVGDPLTLLAADGPASGIVTEGLRYPLRGETLHPGSTRGVSNAFVSSSASVRLDEGVLLVVAPHARSDRSEKETS